MSDEKVYPLVCAEILQYMGYQIVSVAEYPDKHSAGNELWQHEFTVDELTVDGKIVRSFDHLRPIGESLLGDVGWTVTGAWTRRAGKMVADVSESRESMQHRLSEKLARWERQECSPCKKRPEEKMESVRFRVVPSPQASSTELFSCGAHLGSAVAFLSLRGFDATVTQFRTEGEW
jgi:hypothetical protein